MVELTVLRIGEALGVEFPRQALEHLQVSAGDRLILAEDPDGGYRLTRCDPAFAQELDIAAAGMERYAETLRDLAQ